MDELGGLLSGFEKQDIKAEAITLDQVDHMKSLNGTYESLFSRKAMKFRSMGLAEKALTEGDYRQLIHEEYTFLKRPVFVVGNEIFVGNSKKVIGQLRTLLES